MAFLIMLAPLLIAAASSGCSQSVNTPTSPNLSGPAPLGPVTPPSVSPPTGRITPLSVEPRPGATIDVRECQSEAQLRDMPLCSDQFHGVFEVVSDQHVMHPVLTVGFYRGDVLCGYAGVSADHLPPGQVDHSAPLVCTSRPHGMIQASHSRVSFHSPQPESSRKSGRTHNPRSH